MALRTVASFVAYKADVEKTSLPAIARGAEGVVTLAAPDTTFTSTSVQPLTQRSRRPFDVRSNVHGVVEGFLVDVSENRPGVWFTSGDVSTYQRFEEGRRGLPGSNAVPTDTAIAAHMRDFASDTSIALDEVVAGNLEDTGSATYAAITSGQPYVLVRPTGEDSTAVLQEALDNVANVPTIVLEPNGVYKLNAALQFFEGTQLIGNRATLKRMHNSYLMINGVRNSPQFGYTNNGNIGIYDVDLDQNGVENATIASTVAFVHGHHIHFERCRFLNTTSHAYELNSSYHVRIIDCQFLGYNDVKPGSGTEAIQLDISTPKGQYAFQGGDMTPCKDILISGCTFAGYEGLNASSTGIGAHKSRIDRPQEDIVIENCDFQGLAKWAIRGFHWNNVSVRDNRVRDCQGFMYIQAPPEGNGLTENTLLADGTQTGRSASNYGYSITGNDVIETEQAIYFVGMPTGRITDTVISGNRFVGTIKAGAYGVWGRQLTELTMSENSFNRYERAVHFWDSDGLPIQFLRILNNNIRGSSEHGVYLSGVLHSTISNNTFRNNGYENTSNGSHVLITGDATQNVGVIGNNMSASSTANRARYGLYITSAVNRVLYNSNVIYAAATTAIRDDGGQSVAGTNLT